MSVSKPGILILNDTTAYAGTEQYIFVLCCKLTSIDENVSVACDGNSPLALRLRDANQTVLPVCPAPFKISALKAVTSLLRKGSVQILHANNGRTALFGALAVKLAGTGRLVMTQHFLEPQYVARRGLKAWLSNLAHHWVDRKTDHVIANSQASGRGALARGEVTPDRLTVIPNGIAAVDRATLRPVKAVRDELGLTADMPLIACVARLEPEKDIATLVDAMALTFKQFPDAVCVAAGEGSLREELQKQISQLGIARSVQLLGFRKDVASIVHASDLFVLPSVAEPFGLALVEAMSLGKAAIAVAAGGPLEIVDDGITGLLVPPRSASEMAAAIGKLIASPETRLQMGARGEERYRAAFTDQRMAEQTSAVFRRVLSLQAENNSHEAATASVSP